MCASSTVLWHWYKISVVPCAGELFGVYIIADCSSNKKYGSKK
jgi:hypothetical protein